MACDLNRNKFNMTGFGSSPSTSSFGQSGQLFGNTSNNFGAGTSGFGSNSQPIFGNTPQNAAPLFGQSTAPTFGQSNQSSGFGSNPFGANPQPSSSGAIFGTTNNTNFGQQNKQAGFGFPSSPSTTLFGQNAQAQQNASGSVFQPSSSSALFGSSSTFGPTTGPTGTVTKFVPVTGTDSVQKSGASQSINTKHFCITCMKEYENKSLEELRWEDYQANRRGPQAFGGGGGGGGTSQPFGIASTNTTLFGPTENKPVFGQTSTGFGAQPNFGINSQTTAPNMFGKASTGFGSTSTTNSFAFSSTPTTGIFNANTSSKPFSVTGNQPLFGQAQQPQQNNFGTPTFNQPSTTTTNLFSKPAQQQGGFNMGQSTFQFGTQPPNTSSVFQNQKPSSGFNVFGQNTTANSFGQPQQQSNFTGFNNFGMKNNTMFNNTSKNMFTPNTNLFGNNSFQPSSGFNLQAQPQQVMNMQGGNEQQSGDGRPAVVPGDPYGYNPHLDPLFPNKIQTNTYATNPKELQKYLEAPQPIAVVPPTTKRLKVFPPIAKKTNLFGGGLDARTTQINMTLKSSAKRLTLRDDLSRESSETSLTTLSDMEDNITFAPTNRPLFISPLRLRKSPLTLGEFSSSGILSTKPSLTDLSEKSDQSTESTQVNTSDFTDCIERSVASGDTNTSSNTSEPTRFTCGIILTRHGYYTVPPLNKLVDHRLGDGQCLVRGFTIGRVGYGNVSFPELIDVSNLNLDELVHFRYRELTIYPDDSKKPPLGQGLNRRAQVTLDRVFPKSKVDRKLITDVETLVSINFMDTLRDLCEKHGTRFLDYRPETGSWVFMVEHFSKYEFAESDDDDEEAAALDAQSKEKMLALMAASSKESVQTQQAPDEDIFLDDDEIMAEDTPMQAESVASETSDTLEFEQESTTDLARVESSDSLLQVQARRDLYKIPHESDNLRLMKATLFEEEDYDPVNIESDNIETLGKSKRALRNFGRSTVPGQKVEDNDRRKPRSFVLINKFCTIPLEKSMCTSRNYMDIAAFKSRSFKVGWGRGLSLAMGYNGLEAVPSPHTPMPRNHIQIVDIAKLPAFNPLTESLTAHLEIVLESSDFVPLQGIPFCVVARPKQALERHQYLARRTYLGDPTKRVMSYYKETWELIVALWGDITFDTTRREELARWFQEVLAKEVFDILNAYRRVNQEQITKEIFVRLIGLQVFEACELAMRNDMPKLALLLSQINLSPDTKPILQYQLDQWKTSMSVDFIPVVLQKIYMLLSGTLVFDYESRNTMQTVNVCEYLNWRQCFAVILWYMSCSSDPVSRSLQIYKDGFENSVCAKPTPDHLDNGMNISDLQYHLIKLHCNKSTSLEEILNPLTHTTYGADYRLSWLLLQTFTALQVGILNEEARVVISTSFSIQLESLGYPKWAIFPLLFIEECAVRKDSIMSSLHRNMESKVGDLTEDQLIKKLHIAPEWLHEVKACRTNLLGMHWQSYQHLLHTHRWYEAHRIAVQHLIPDLIISESFDVLEKILCNLDKGKGYICGWNDQGGLLLDFLKVAKQCNQIELSRDQALVTHSALLEVITKLFLYPLESAKHIAAISEISKRCYIFAKSLIHVMQPTYSGVVTVTSLELERLVMPADYIFEALQQHVLNA